MSELEALTSPRGLLADDAITAEEGWSIPKRLAFARRLEQGFAVGGQWARRWEETLPAIRVAYPGLELAPQVGLVPLGPDPESGLHEFAHLATGDVPERGDGGHLVVTEAMAVVFVLLPGGTFWMGSQRDDPAQPNYLQVPQRNEVPAHMVTFSPFFLAKYEMTQGQWLRLRRDDPSQYAGDAYSPRYDRTGRRADRTWPVQMVNWSDALETCEHHGMTLPTEAQWEYAARAGTTTTWWTGSDSSDLAPAANLKDQYAKANGLPDGAHESWDDGYTVTSPVGSFAANPFGLYDVHGNVWEWCLDGYQEFFYSRAGSKDPLSPPEGSDWRVFRGGSFNGPASVARSAFRSFGSPDLTGYWIGLRPARAIEK